MAALDLLGRRWSLRILWELREGPLGARALRGRCDAMSSSVLYDRLRDLTAAGLVGKDEDNAYVLTEVGRSLGAALAPLDRWAQTWAAGYSDRTGMLGDMSGASDHGAARAARWACGPPAKRSADHARR
jgi:DNA-binding HxlR family transcriptional regulator